MISLASFLAAVADGAELKEYSKNLVVYAYKGEHHILSGEEYNAIAEDLVLLAEKPEVNNYSRILGKLKSAGLAD